MNYCAVLVYVCNLADLYRNLAVIAITWKIAKTIPGNFE